MVECSLCICMNMRKVRRSIRRSSISFWFFWSDHLGCNVFHGRAGVRAARFVFPYKYPTFRCSHLYQFKKFSNCIWCNYTLCILCTLCFTECYDLIIKLLLITLYFMIQCVFKTIIGKSRISMVYYLSYTSK